MWYVEKGIIKSSPYWQFITVERECLKTFSNAREYAKRCAIDESFTDKLSSEMYWFRVIHICECPIQHSTKGRKIHYYRPWTIGEFRYWAE